MLFYAIYIHTYGTCVFRFEKKKKKCQKKGMYVARVGQSKMLTCLLSLTDLKVYCFREKKTNVN